jgi:hypothetical protein
MPISSTPFTFRMPYSLINLFLRANCRFRESTVDFKALRATGSIRTVPGMPTVNPTVDPIGRAPGASAVEACGAAVVVAVELLLKCRLGELKERRQFKERRFHWKSSKNVD